MARAPHSTRRIVPETYSTPYNRVIRCNPSRGASLGMRNCGGLWLSSTASVIRLWTLSRARSFGFRAVPAFGWRFWANDRGSVRTGYTAEASAAGRAFLDGQPVHAAG